MKVKAIAPWFGGKRTMADDIVKQLGPHGQYFEPFCGSMAVLFAKPPCQKETVNDLHGDLVNLARCIQDQPFAERLYERLQRCLFSDDILAQARIELERPLTEATHFVPDPDRAYWYFIASWMGRNGTAGTARVDYQLAVRWTKGGGSPTVRWRNALESLPAWHNRLRNVVILRRDAFKILDGTDRGQWSERQPVARFEDVKETAVYVDPPYHADTRSFTKNGMSSKYLHEFEHEEGLFGHNDHVRLRDILNCYKKARIVVSYYDCPEVRELYEGWTFIEKTRQKHLHAQNGRGARPKDAPELLIVNGPEY